jgi:tRNA-splicing ligase RtcB
MIVIYSEKNPIKSWCNNPEEGAISQAKNLANLPFLHKHVALMPDTHQGYGMPVGGVIACDGVIIPNAVGVDIGCGMVAVKMAMQHKDLTTEQLKQIMGKIRQSVPLGFNHHKESKVEEMNMFNLGADKTLGLKIVQAEFNNAAKQIGTLGGGNHFIEVQKGNDGHVWFMLHSGSRNLGKKVADHYNKVAIDINKKFHVSVPLEHELAFLPLDTKEAQDYLNEMDYCLRFALASRTMMAEAIKNAFREVIPGVAAMEEINIHHNYASLENHYGKNVWVHRKGATSAKEGQVGIIPGSQGTSSCIVRGKGNPESFMSCSHGAGRKMSRTQAQKTLNLQEEVKRMEDKGILHGIRGKDDLDEAAGSYKDIDTVMDEQKDLVDIIVKLEPMGVIKG